MDIIEIRNNLENLPDIIYQKELEMGEAKAQLNHMKDLTKHILAKEKIKVSGSNAFKEESAYSSDSYLSLIHI